MEKAFKKTLRAFATVKISHAGSTVTPGILARSIVDITTEFALGEDTEWATKAIESLGSVRRYTESGRIFPRLGHTKEGFAKKVFHLHLRYRGNYDELYFRDYLRENLTLTSECEALKR